MATSNNPLRALYIDELRDIYNAEKQLTKLLPKMAKAATSGELRNGFTEHLERTTGHVERLEQIFEALGERPSGKKCDGMEGLSEEGFEAIDKDFDDVVIDDTVIDDALISATQRVEHSEIAAYGTVCAIAELLGESEHLSLLQQTVEEVKQTDAKLTELSKEMNTVGNANPRSLPQDRVKRGERCNRDG